MSAFSRLRVGVACLDNCLGYSPPASLRGNCVSYGLTDILLDSTADTWVGWWWVLAALTAVRVTALLSANLYPNVSCKDREQSLYSALLNQQKHEQKRDKNTFPTGTETKMNWNKKYFKIEWKPFFRKCQLATFLALNYRVFEGPSFPQDPPPPPTKSRPSK